MADIKKIKIGNDELDVTKKQDKIDSTHKLSADLVNDSSSTHKFTTAADISKLSGIEAGAEVNVQSDWSQTTTTADDYIKNKPTIGNATLTIQKNSTTIDTFTANATSNKTINIPIPTTAADVSALPSSTKYGASISVSVNSTDYKITTTLKDQDGNTLGTAQVVDLPLESVVVSGSFDSTNKKIILTLQNGNTVDIPVGDLVAGLQTEITSENKLDSDLVDDTNQAHKFMTAAERTKLSGIATGAEVNVQSDWNVTDNTSDAFIKNKPNIPTVNNATLTIQKNGTTVQTFTANQSTAATANITVPIVDSTLSDTSTNAVENKAVTTKINELDRYYRSLVPVGTAITAEGTDLNTVTYLKVGKYYCSLDATTKTFVNCPTTNAFMMEVFSPLSTTIDNEATSQWVYRVRILTTYFGKMYIQKANSSSTAGTFSYGTWEEFAYTSNLNAKPNSYWGTCTTAAATAAKVVTVASAQNFKLIPGAMITFKAPNTNTAQNPTINVNSTGAKPVFYNSAVVTTSNLNKAGQNGRPATYVYDGTNWVWISWSTDDNTTYSTMSVSEGTTGTATNARTVRADYLKQIIEHYIPDIVDMTGATSSTAGAHGLVPAPAAGDNTKFLRGDGTWQIAGGGSYTAGAHIDITNNVIKAKDYVHSENPVAASQASTISGSQITNGSIDSTKLAQGAVLTLQTTTTDPGEGAALPENTLLGVYNLPHEYKPGEILVAAQNMSELNWGGTTKVQWSAGSWTQYGPFAKTTEPSWLQITTPENEEWVVKLHHITGTAKPNSSSWSHSGLLQASAPATQPYTYLTTSLVANGDLYLHQETNYIVTIPANTSTAFAVWVRTNSTANCIWYGGNPITDSSSSSFNFGPSCIIEATLIEKRIV